MSLVVSENIFFKNFKRKIFRSNIFTLLQNIAEFPVEQYLMFNHYKIKINYISLDQNLILYNYIIYIV